MTTEFPVEMYGKYVNNTGSTIHLNFSAYTFGSYPGPFDYSLKGYDFVSVFNGDKGISYGDLETKDVSILIDFLESGRIGGTNKPKSPPYAAGLI